MEAAQLLTKPDNLSSIPRTHMVKVKNNFHQPSSDLHVCTMLLCPQKKMWKISLTNMRNRKAHRIFNSFPSCCQDNTSAFTCHLIVHQYTTSFLHKESDKSFDGRNVMACEKVQSLPPWQAAAPEPWHQIGEIKPHSERRKKWEAGRRMGQNRTGGLRRNHLRWWKVRGRGNEIWVRKYVERKQKSRRWREMEKRKNIYSNTRKLRPRKVKQLARCHSLKA